MAIKKTKKAQEKLEYQDFVKQLITRRHGVVMKAEYVFHPVRKWRFDFAHLATKLAIEVEGGTWTGGGHSRGSGQTKDREKHNAAEILGWTILRFSPKELESKYFVDTVDEFFKNFPQR